MIGRTDQIFIARHKQSVYCTSLEVWVLEMFESLCAAWGVTIAVTYLVSKVRPQQYVIACLVPQHARYRKVHLIAVLWPKITGYIHNPFQQ